VHVGHHLRHPSSPGAVSSAHSFRALRIRAGHKRSG
jgi:hypothetical protein